MQTQCARVAFPLTFRHFRCKNRLKQNKASAGNADVVQMIQDIKMTRCELEIAQNYPCALFVGSFIVICACG